MVDLVAVLLYLLVAEDHLDQLSALGLVQKQQAILNGAVQIPVQLVVSGNAEERGVVGVGGRAVQPQVRIKNQARLVVLLDLRCHQGGAAEVEVEQRIRPVFALVLQLGRQEVNALLGGLHKDVAAHKGGHLLAQQGERLLEHIVVQAPAHQRGQGAGLLFVQVAELLFKALVQQVVKQGIQLVAGDVGVLQHIGQGSFQG